VPTLKTPGFERPPASVGRGAVDAEVDGPSDLRQLCGKVGRGMQGPSGSRLGSGKLVHLALAESALG